MAPAVRSSTETGSAQEANSLVRNKPQHSSDPLPIALAAQRRGAVHERQFGLVTVAAYFGAEDGAFVPTRTRLPG